MQTIEVPDQMYQQVEAFADVYRAVMNEDTDVSTCFGIIFDRGFRAALGDILQNQNQDVLVESIQQLASRYPDLVCRYIADMIGLGADLNRSK